LKLRILIRILTVDNYEFSEHLRKNFVTIDNLDNNGKFEIGGLDFLSSYASLSHRFNEACRYRIKRHQIKASSPDVLMEYDFYRLDIDNVRLIFWMNLLHYRILSELGEELKNYSRGNFWNRYRCMVWERTPSFIGYDYARDVVLQRMNEHIIRFTEIIKKAKHILTFLGNEEIDNL